MRATPHVTAGLPARPARPLPRALCRLTVLIAAGWLPGTLHAQSTTAARVRAVTATGSMNACVELASSPSPLVQAPEGLALLRLKRQLESAALTLEQRRQLERDQLQRIAQVRRGMDSLIQIVVRRSLDDGERAIEREAAAFAGSGGRRMIVTMDNGNGPVTLNLEAMMRGAPVTGDSTAVTITPLRALQPEVDRVIRLLQPQVAQFAGEAEAALPGGAAAPSGYMGLSLSGAQIRIVTPEGVMTSHCEYPLVETVDVGSPAARAGLAAGDTLVAYNGRDVMQTAVNYPDLITAGNTVRVRVRRAGKPREVPVVVDERRDEAPSAPVRLRLGGRTLTAIPVPAGDMFSPSGVTVLAGAQFATMDDDFAQSLGLEAGVLVLRVPGGTPAAEAGLKAGDVVRSVNGVAVRDVAGLRRVLSASREARLSVQARGGTTRVVVLPRR